MSHKLKYLKVVSSRYPSPQKWYWISVDRWEQYLLVRNSWCTFGTIQWKVCNLGLWHQIQHSGSPPILLF